MPDHPWLRAVAVCLATTTVALSPSWASATEPPAFRGAEGFGATATGGRGGDVYYVTSLDDSGPGTLRDAVSRGDRMILFQVSGTIELQSTLRVAASNITIAGQTAPGEGICLRGKELLISGDNVIVRFLRVRPGDELGQEHDAITIWAADRVILDHCSMSWSTDSLNDVVKGSTNVTVQWCILSEPLNRSVHVKGAHGYGTGWGSGPGGGATFHHNLLAHCNSRSPRIGSDPGALIDVRNNVIYNMGGGWAYGGEHARINYVANYFKPGVDTAHPRSVFRISNPETRIHLAGNVIEAHADVSADNALALVIDDGVDRQDAVVSAAFATPPIDATAADVAYEAVLTSAGAIQPRRDAVDARIVADVRSGSGHIIDSPREFGGWPTLASTPPPADRDRDGLPDAWEAEHGTDPEAPADGSWVRADGFTELEHYLDACANRRSSASSDR